MPPDLASRILHHIQSLWPTHPLAEITLEMNPDDVLKAKEFMQAGINRFSMGVQSFDAKTLLLLGRHHTTDHLQDALTELRSLGARYSFDLIYGHAHHENLAQWEAELVHARQWVSEHLSLYQLSYETGTPFYRKRHHTLPDDHLLILEEMTHDALSPLGLERYEVSNYALPGHHSIHNCMYWLYQEFLGIGPGAHGRLETDAKHPLSTYNIGLPERWSAQVRDKGHGCIKETRLTREQRSQEQLLMGLRLAYGLPLSFLWNDDEQATPAFMDRIQHAIEQGLIEPLVDITVPPFHGLQQCPVIGPHINELLSRPSVFAPIAPSLHGPVTLNKTAHLQLTHKGRCVLNSVVDYLTKSPLAQ